MSEARLTSPVLTRTAEVSQVQANLVLERIERRLCVDTISDCDWLRTTADAAEGHLRILASMRYSEEDVHRYGAAQVREWIAEDQRRHEAFQEGEWLYLDICATAIIGVHLGEERIGQIGYCSMTVGGIESDSPREHLDEMTEVLVTEVKEELAARGFVIPADMPTPYVLSESWVADAV